MQQLISGIQQVGIGVPDAADYFTWFRRTFGLNVKIFDDEAKATLMTRYTGGEVHSRRAILAMNMHGGGGAEIWQFTSRNTVFNPVALQWGDLGINAVKMKCTDVEKAHLMLEGKVDCSPICEGPHNEKSFWVTDHYGNHFRVVQEHSWFKKHEFMMGGICGVMVGVTNMEKSLEFYQGCLGITELVYDKTGTWNDLGEAYKNQKFRRVLLRFTNNYTAPFSRLLGNVQVELIQALDRTPAKIYHDRYWGDGGFIHVCFDVSNMDLLKARMAEHHVTFTVDSADTFDMGESGGRFSYAEDPDGTLIEMVETHKVPIMKKLGWYLNLKKRGQTKPLPNWMVSLMGLNKVTD
jgi:catechol 2,3-dioxygenase-like lactoylglutathione lyase family enzyme